MLSSRWSRASSLQMSSSTSLRMQAVPSLLFELEVCFISIGHAKPSHVCMHACMHTKESPTLRTQMLTGCLCPPAAGGSWAGAAWPASQQSFDPSAAAPEQPPCTGGVMSKYGQPATQRGLPAWLCKHAAVHLIHLVQCSHLASTSTPIMTHIIHAAAPPPPHPTPLTHP